MTGRILLNGVEQLHSSLILLMGIGFGAIAVWLFSALSTRKSQFQYDAVWLHSISEQAELGMNLTAPDGRYLRVNQAYCRMIGYTEAELLGGMRWQDVTYPDDVQLDASLVQQSCQSREPAYVLRKKCICKDGTLIWVKIHVSPVYDDQGELKFVTTVAENISDLYHAELALRESEATNRAILEAIPDLLLRITKDGLYASIVESNSTKAMAILPYCVGCNIYSALPKDLADQRMSAIQAALESRKLQIYEQSITIGEIVQQEEVRVTAINDEETLVMIRDVSDRKRAEQALQQQASLQQALNQVTQTIRNSLDVVTIYSTAVCEFAHLLQAQQAVLSEYIPAEQIWRNIAFFNTAPDTPSGIGVEISDVNNPIAAQLKQGEIVCIPDAQELCEDTPNQQLAARFPGSWLILPVTFLNKLWGGLALVRTETFWQDSDIQLAKAITGQLAIAIQHAELYEELQQLNTHLEQEVEERTVVIQKALALESLLKRITDKVRDSLDENQILQTAVEELGQGLGVICCNASLYSSDLTTCKISHEYSIEGNFGLGQEILFQTPLVERIIHQLMQAQSFQLCFPMESFTTARDEFYTVLVCPMLDDHGVLGDLWLFRPKEELFSDLDIRVVQQVTNQCAIALRQSRLYQLAQSQVAELARLNQLKDDFLSTVSHELRTPMSNIKMATQMLEINLDKLNILNTQSDRVGVYLNILQDECKREISLINDLLDLSRLDAGSEPLTVSTMNLGYWLAHIAEVFGERARLAQQQLVMQLDHTAPTLTTDFAYLELVLMELLHNACKYTPQLNTIRVTANWIDAQATRQDNPDEQTSVQIEIANSGVEIPPEELSHVFDKFYRVPNNDPWKHGGTGLGLALVKKRVERIRGTIAVTSVENWTTFTLQLPQLLEQPSNLPPFTYSWHR